MRSDLRNAWRTHRAAPGFTLVAALIIALGIGANTTVFSVANHVLLKSLPYSQPEQLVALFEARPRETVSRHAVSPADFMDWRDQNTVFSSLSSYDNTTYNYTGRDDAQQYEGGVVSGRFFETLDVQPAAGRLIGTGDELRGSNRVIVLTHGFWQRHFGGDRSVVGQSINLNGWPHTIVGVTPESFVPPVRGWQLIGPLQFDAESRSQRADHFMSVIARLRPGVSPEAARSEMDGISKQLEAAHRVNKGHYASVMPLDEAMRGSLRPAMQVLLAAVGLVLLIACFNVANLLLARSIPRSREVSIRLALGATRGNILRQLLIESLTLSLLGAGVGVLAASWGTSYLATLIPDQLGLSPEDVRIDGLVLLFAVLLALVSGAIFGLAPALTAARGSVIDVIRSGGAQHTASAWRNRQRALIVAGETALSVMLLVGAGLLVRSFVKLLEVDPGFRAEKLLTLQMALPASKYREDTVKTAFQRQLLDKVRSLPGVTNAGITSALPVTGQGGRMGFEVEGIDPPPGEPRRANWRIATPGYFETMGIPTVRGRVFSERDLLETPVVMVINETAAKRYWGDRNPVGTRARLATMQMMAEVIGVVKDVRHWGLEEGSRPEAFLSCWQAPFWQNNLVVRTQGDPMQLAGAIRAEIRAIDRDIPSASIRSMEDIIDESTALRRFYMLLLTILAAIAMLLAGAGIYAQLAYSVSQRTKEIGLRMVLGAKRSDVIGMILREGMTLTISGAVVGLIAAMMLSQLLEKLLFGVEPLDWVALVAAPLALIAVAAIACLAPSWRASRAEPAVALRYE